MQFTTIFFDLDDTLYSSQNGLWKGIRERMNRYMVERMQLPPAQVSHLRQTYFETYGTTLRGLHLHYGIDPDEFLAYVHDLPVAGMLKPDLVLRQMVESLPQHKYIFTNADQDHARRVLAALQMDDCFDGIIDIHAMGLLCKPDLRVYRTAMQIAGESDPQRCVYLDDSVRNLVPAHQIGFYTVLISPNGAEEKIFDLTLRRPHDLIQSLPQLKSSTGE